MNVVRHYHPSRETVFRLIVKEQCILHYGRNSSIVQIAITVTLIEISLHSTAHDSFNLARLLVLKLFFPAKKYRARQSVVQSEGKELG
jgi:hypothetical protein